MTFQKLLGFFLLFPRTFPGLEKNILKCHDCSSFPMTLRAPWWAVRTRCIVTPHRSAKCYKPEMLWSRSIKWRSVDAQTFNLTAFIYVFARMNNVRRRFHNKLLKKGPEGDFFLPLLIAFVWVPSVPDVLGGSSLLSLGGPSAARPEPFLSKCICSHSRDAAHLHRDPHSCC